LYYKFPKSGHHSSKSSFFSLVFASISCHALALALSTLSQAAASSANCTEQLSGSCTALQVNGRHGASNKHLEKSREITRNHVLQKRRPDNGQN
jgi:hypothetical protein